MTLDAQPLQVGFVIRATFEQRNDVIKLFRKCDPASRVTVHTQRLLGKQFAPQLLKLPAAHASF